MTLMECICNIFGSCMSEQTDDVEKKPKDAGTHVTFDLENNIISEARGQDGERRVSFNLGNNVYLVGGAVYSTVLENSKSSFDSVDLTGGDDQETSSDVG